VVERVRSRPWLAVAVAAGGLLLVAWIAWAIYVAVDRGAREGLGVLIAWPALVAACLLVCLPFAAIYLIVRRQPDSDSTVPAAEPPGEPEA
jgi:hypothetical protein